MRRIADLPSLDGKRVIIRCDLNVPLDGDRITDDGRIVASVPTRPIVPLRVSVAAGLIAGTVPTTGISSTSRTMPSAMVLAVLQAMQTSRGRYRSAILPSSPATRAAIWASVLVP